MRSFINGMNCPARLPRGTHRRSLTDGRIFRFGLICIRIALNMPQVRQYAPPPNFVKESDARTPAYRAQFGTDDCWELDALSPTVIADLIRAEVTGLIDQTVLDEVAAAEERNRDLLDRGGRKLDQGRETPQERPSAMTDDQERIRMLAAASPRPMPRVNVRVVCAAGFPEPRDQSREHRPRQQTTARPVT
jgi:hypothetical protein